MAFDAKNLRLISTQCDERGWNVWRYRSADDNIAAILAGDYFLAYRRELGVGDVILATGSDKSRALVVATNTGSALTTAVFNYA